MHKLLYCSAALMLAGCAGVYDPSAVSVAKAANDQAYGECLMKFRSGQIPNYSALTECYLAADLVTAKAIRLTRMDLYDGYAARFRQMAAATDAGRLPPDGFEARQDGIQRDFAQSMLTAYAADEAGRQQAAAAFVAMGGAMQQAGAAYPAATPPPQRPVTCTTSPATLGGSTLGGSNTTCH